MTITDRLHFCWIGQRMPWAYVFAVLSAAGRSAMADIVVHHTDPLDRDDAVKALAAAPRVRLSRLDPDACLSRASQKLGLRDRLETLHAMLSEPAMRADLLRAAILYLEGGIYLDLDTVTVAPLTSLLNEAAFVGCERVVWPPEARASRSPARLARHVALDLVRKACRAAPQGWRAFRHVQSLYPCSVNNAVMGSVAESAFLSAYLSAMPVAERTSRYAIGPHLLGRVIDTGAGSGVTVHAPEAFYPLAPEISEHWFRIVRAPRLTDVLRAGTRVVHWYASVRTRKLVARITPDYVLQHRHRQLYSALVSSTVDVERLVS